MVMRKIKRFCKYEIMNLLVSDKFISLKKGGGVQAVVVDNVEKLDILSSVENDFWEVVHLYNLARKEKGILIAIIDDKIPIAFGVLLKKGSKGTYFKIKKTDAYIGALYTFPNFRNQGYMTQLIYKMIELAQNEWNAKTISLCVLEDNLKAKSLYKKIGFFKVSVKYFVKIYKYKIPYYKI